MSSEFEIKEGTVNVPAGMRISDKSLLNQLCQARFKAPPTYSTVYHTVVLLPDDRVFVGEAATHIDSQARALEAIKPKSVSN
jgi:hypothetical protein